MFYIYILYSKRSDKYYVGHTNDPERRLSEHNLIEGNKYTAKYRPWSLVSRFPVSENRSNAITIEKYIKSRKSRNLIRKLIDNESDTKYLEQFFTKILLKNK